MDRSANAWVVAVPEHIFGENTGARNARLNQPVCELISIESLADPSNVLRIVELDVHFSGRGHHGRSC
jgi:hypothetical protein